MKNLIEQLTTAKKRFLSIGDCWCWISADTLERLTEAKRAIADITRENEELCVKLENCTIAKDRLTEGDVALPKAQWLGDIPGCTLAQLKGYGDRRAAAAVLAERERFKTLSPAMLNIGVKP